MKVEIPEFLIELSEQLNTQDNRMTADPIFAVCYDKKLPTDEDHAEGYEWFDPEGADVIGDDDDLVNHLKEHHSDFVKDHCEECELDIEELTVEDFEYYDLPAGIRKEFYLKEQTFVKASLTEVGAQQFIDRKQRDYPPLYIYAYSMCFQWQMIDLRKWLMSLTDKPNT